MKMRLNFVLLLALLSVSCTSQDVATFGDIVKFGDESLTVSASHQASNQWLVTGSADAVCSDALQNTNFRITVTASASKIEGDCNSCLQTGNNSPTGSSR